jgi:hypothetical protein
MQLSHSPGLLRSCWIRLLSVIGYMPRVTVVGDPDNTGRSLRITYRVYYAFWMGSPYTRCFYGLPEIVVPSEGNSLRGRTWDRVACDRIEYNTRTREGKVEFNPANPSY